VLTARPVVLRSRIDLHLILAEMQESLERQGFSARFLPCAPPGFLIIWFLRGNPAKLGHHYWLPSGGILLDSFSEMSVAAQVNQTITSFLCMFPVFSVKAVNAEDNPRIVNKL